MANTNLMDRNSVEVRAPKTRCGNRTLNSYAERWVKSVKEECLSRLILFRESPLRRASQQYPEHYHGERNHPGKDNRDLVSFAAGSKKEQRSSAVSGRTGRPAEVLREGSGIRVDGAVSPGGMTAHHVETGRRADWNLIGFYPVVGGVECLVCC